MQLKDYMTRIAYEGKLEATLHCLKKLHKCHVMSIPFEALDIHLGISIKLDLEHIFQKIVYNKRGGYCYELNFLFCSFLKEIGFDVWMISASIFDDNNYGPDFDHMAIAVDLKGLWLVDVGFGDLFIEPVKINVTLLQEDNTKMYKFNKLSENEFLLSESLKSNIDFRPKYKFTTTPRSINEFHEQNIWKQTSTHSHFVKNRICTIATNDGRKSIINNMYKVRSGNNIKAMEIADEKEFQQLLRNEFYIDLKIKKVGLRIYYHAVHNCMG